MLRAVLFVFGVGVSLSNAALNPISLEVAIIPNRTVLPEVVSNNVSGRSLVDDFYERRQSLLQNFRETTLPFVVKELGLIECAGIDHATGGHFFETIMGPGADFGGNYLCEPTCGGECIPTQGLGEAPISIYYPFGCRCAPHRCDARGPIVTDLIRPLFKVVCARDERCTCASMSHEPGSQIGYICNWINLNTQLPVTFLDRPLFQGYHPTYSPIRWCSCCPNHG